MTVDPFGINQPSANPDPLGAPPAPVDSPGYLTYDPFTGTPLSVPPAPPSPAPYAHPGQYPPAAGLPPVYPQPGAVPPGYPGPAAPVPGYGPPPLPGYGPGYAPVAGYPGGYAPAVYPGFPLPPARPARPGGATGAAVLAFVQAGLNIIGGFTLFGGGSALTEVNRYNGLDASPAAAWTILGIAALVSGGLLIAGGARVFSRHSALLIVGALLSLAISAYLAVELSGLRYVGGFTVWVPIAYAVMPIIGIALLFGADVRRWLRER